jgi:hypothetical protein
MAVRPLNSFDADMFPEYDDPSYGPQAPHFGVGPLMMHGGAARGVAALATQASNPRHKREVCRYWLQSKCQKGDACEFLHAMDYSKMPSCPLGDSCDAEECPFKHADPKRPECSNYQIGFCSFGRQCPHRHVERHAGHLPEVSPYWLTAAAPPAPPELAYSAVAYAARKKAESRHWRTRVCDYFDANGWCPYFDMCNFAHGPVERQGAERGHSRGHSRGDRPAGLR